MNGMTGTGPLLSVRRAWPWGLVVVTDPGSSEDVPSQLDPLGVAAGESILAVHIVHEVDGEATAEIWLNPPPDEGLTAAYSGDFTTACGAVILGDAAYENHLPAEVGEGTHRLRVLVDDVGHPTRVIFEFGATD